MSATASILSNNNRLKPLRAKQLLSTPHVTGLKLIRIQVLLDFSLTVKAATLIFISGCGSAISSAKEGKSGFIYNLVKN